VPALMRPKKEGNMIEATCRVCGDTFNPGPDDYNDDGAPIHWNRTDDGPEQGDECGGIGVIAGAWATEQIRALEAEIASLKSEIQDREFDGSEAMLEAMELAGKDVVVYQTDVYDENGNPRSTDELRETFEERR